MNKMQIIIPLLAAAGFLATACNSGKQQEEKLVTRRIEYDVTIKSPEPDLDWWLQNIEGPSREKLVSDIMDAVLNEKVKAFDYFSCEPLDKQRLQDIKGRTDTIFLERADKPGEFFDTIVNHTINLKEITRLRFLEEWYMNKNSLVFEKKIMGICPLLERYDNSGNLRGYSPLFWVFFDDRYPGLLKQTR